jgi:hypothetical protein
MIIGKFFLNDGHTETLDWIPNEMGTAGPVYNLQLLSETCLFYLYFHSLAVNQGWTNKTHGSEAA